MKIAKLLPVAMLLFLFSCQKNEMIISRADQTIVGELIKQSPIYITKNEDGSLKINENNRIGNTDWVFTIENNIPIGSIIPDVQRLIEKKYAEGIHSDNKKVYFLYMDTVANKMAYLPIDGLEFFTTKSDDSTALRFDKNLATEQFIQEMVKVTTADTLVTKTAVYIY